jgi:phosphate starvation-inducible membrane PsiE
MRNFNAEIVSPTLPSRSKLANIIVTFAQVIMIIFYFARAFAFKEANDPYNSWNYKHLLTYICLFTLFGSFSIISHYLKTPLHFTILGIIILVVLGIAPFEITLNLAADTPMAYI